MKKEKQRTSDMPHIGAKFYKVLKSDNDNIEVEILRLLKIKNVDCYVLYDENFNEVKLTSDEFSKYTRLIPDGYITCSIVGMYGLNDVIVSLVRHKDVIDTKEYVPFAVCRQQISDLFANAFYNDGKTKVGLSINRNNCPKGINISDVLVYTDPPKYNRTISVYLDDSIDDIIRFISSCKFDEVLSDMYEFNFNNENIIGKVKTLKELLTSNDFYSDFLEAFDITSILDVVEFDDNNNVLPNIIHNIQVETNIKMINPILIKYDHTIDLDKVKRDYKLIKDSTSIVYVCCYTDGGLIKSL
jgi:hypothetical protein